MARRYENDGRWPVPAMPRPAVCMPTRQQEQQRYSVRSTVSPLSPEGQTFPSPFEFVVAEQFGASIIERASPRGFDGFGCSIADLSEKIAISEPGTPIAYDTVSLHSSESQIRLPPPSARPPPSSKQPPPPPDGGLVAWLQCLGSFFLFFNCWGVVNTYGVFQTFYEQSLLTQQTSSAISWVGSIQAFLLMFIGMVTGPFFDAGYLRALLGAGTILVSMGMMLTSASTQYWQVLLAQGIITGLGCGCLFVPSVAILPTYFNKRKALAMGIGASGSSLGGIIYPILFHRVQPIIGFAWATRAMAFIILVTLSVPLVCMKQRLKPPARRKFIDLSALRDPAYLLFGIAEFFAFMGLYVPFFYVQLFAIERGIVNANFGFYLLAIMNAGSFFGRIIPNHIADKVGPMHVLIVCGTMTSFLGFLWMTVATAPAVVLFCIFYGFFSGSFVSLPPAVVVTLAPHPSTIGVRLGMIFVPIACGLLVGNPVAGAILPHGWTGLMVFCGCCVLLSAGLIFAARIAKAGWKLKRVA